METSAETAYQYRIREREIKKDYSRFNISVAEANELRVSDFDFEIVHHDDREGKLDCIEFIKRYEWLGKVAQRNTHWFVARYKDKLAGVIIMSVPNAFSKLCGEGTADMEKLISRGACAAFTPKNLASALLSWSIDWMVKNTRFRVFPAYSDKEAGELGTIYQAANFVYLGDEWGGARQLFDTKKPHKGWFSDREIRKVAAYIRYARELGIKWEKKWSTKDRVFWHLMPVKTVQALRKASRDYKSRCIERKLPSKHKYVMIKGQTKRETKELLQRMYERNPKYRPIKSGDRPGFAYPKERGL